MTRPGSPHTLRGLLAAAAALERAGDDPASLTPIVTDAYGALIDTHETWAEHPELARGPLFDAWAGTARAEITPNPAPGTVRPELVHTHNAERFVVFDANARLYVHRSPDAFTVDTEPRGGEALAPERVYTRPHTHYLTSQASADLLLLDTPSPALARQAWREDHVLQAAGRLMHANTAAQRHALHRALWAFNAYKQPVCGPDGTEWTRAVLYAFVARGMLLLGPERGSEAHDEDQDALRALAALPHCRRAPVERLGRDVYYHAERLHPPRTHHRIPGTGPEHAVDAALRATAGLDHQDLSQTLRYVLETTDATPREIDCTLARRALPGPFLAEHACAVGHDAELVIDPGLRNTDCAALATRLIAPPGTRLTLSPQGRGSSTVRLETVPAPRTEPGAPFTLNDAARGRAAYDLHGLERLARAALGTQRLGSANPAHWISIRNEIDHIDSATTVHLVEDVLRDWTRTRPWNLITA